MSEKKGKPAKPWPPQGPLRDGNGVIDSNLCLQWLCMLIFCLGLLLGVIGYPLGWYAEGSGREPPSWEFLTFALSGALGMATVYVTKGRMGQGSTPQQPPPEQQKPPTGPEVTS